MIKTIDLIKDVDERYIPMLKEVNIPDFYKCIAQFSGLGILGVDDDTIINYLHTWAENKYRFWKVLGNKIKLDVPIQYARQRLDISNEIEDINNKFPLYSFWLNGFAELVQNKITDEYRVSYEIRRAIDKYFPQYRLCGSTITHFLKNCLKADDELITAVAAIFENQAVEATYTISIDPTDIMLASENPYDWTSCYRLELDNESSHADGCMAALLDKTSLITYIWNTEGKFTLCENEYKFKKIRYKRMRQWIAVSKNFTSIHFNAIYPGKKYDDAFEKQLREVVELLFFNAIENKPLENMWGVYGANTHRALDYGYSEYNSSRTYSLKGFVPENITVFDEPILCPCGCGEVLPCSDLEYDDMEYNGYGFTVENYDRCEQYWCESLGDYCEYQYGDYECQDCSIYRDEHSVCEIDLEECDDLDYGLIDNGVMHCDPEHCKHCPRYKKEQEND